MSDIDIGRPICILDIRYRFRKYWCHFVSNGAPHDNALISILLQLSVPKVKKMTLLLQRTMSSYYPAFRNMLDDLESGLKEAQDISAFLRPLGVMLENLEELSYCDMTRRLPALFHVVALIWANSKFYRQPVRLVVLLQELSNMIIDQVGWKWEGEGHWGWGHK